MVTTIPMTKIERDLITKALSSEGAEVLVEKITDHIVLATGTSSEDALRKEGAGMVLKFMRGIMNNSATIIDHTTQQNNG